MNRYPDAPNKIDTIKKGSAFEKHAHKVLNPWGINFYVYTDGRFQLGIGEDRQGVECKCDDRCLDTGRLSIEIFEKTKAANEKWVPSGILREDNTWLYVQGNFEILFVFAKNWLRRFYIKRIVSDDIHESHGTIQKFYLPIPTAFEAAALVLDGEGNRVTDYTAVQILMQKKEGRA